MLKLCTVTIGVQELNLSDETLFLLMHKAAEYLKDGEWMISFEAEGETTKVHNLDGKTFETLNVTLPETIWAELGYDPKEGDYAGLMLPDER